MRFLYVIPLIILNVILSSCQSDFQGESTVILTKGLFDPIVVTINEKVAGPKYFYGDYEKGRESVAFTYKIQNNSKHPIKDISITFEDIEISEFNFLVNDKGEFLFPGKNGTCQRVLPPGDSCTIEISFFSDKSKKYNQIINLSYDNAVYPNKISTSFYINSGSPAVLIYSDDETIFYFGDLVGSGKTAVVERGLSERRVKNLTIVNTGELTAKNIKFEDDPSCRSLLTNSCPEGHLNAYEYSTNCPQTLAPGAICNVNVFYQPLNKDPEVGELPDELKEIEYRTFLNTNYVNGPRLFQASLQGSFSSLSTRIQARFVSSRENLIFPTKITVGNRLKQSFKISNQGYRSGYLKRIKLFDAVNEVDLGSCERVFGTSMLQCNAVNGEGVLNRKDEAFFINDKDNCFSLEDDNIAFDIGIGIEQSCIIEVIFQPSVSLFNKKNIHDMQLDIVYDSLFQGAETILVDELISLKAESKSQAKLNCIQFQIGGDILDIAGELDLTLEESFESYYVDIDLGRVSLESPQYFQRKIMKIQLENVGATTAKNISIKDGSFDIIPAIDEDPYKVNLGDSEDLKADDKAFFKGVYKTDNCKNLPPRGICTLFAEFAPIGFSNDADEVDSNFFDGYMDGSPRKLFFVEYDSGSRYQDANIQSETEDYDREVFYVILNAAFVRKAKMASFIESNTAPLEWRGHDYIVHATEPFISGNEFEYTFTYRNIGTGPASYLVSPSDFPYYWYTPKLDGDGYDLIPTEDLSSHNADFDCLDIIDFNFSNSDSLSDILNRSAQWNPLDSEKACALTFKMKPGLKDYVSLSSGASMGGVWYTGFSWLSRGFDALGEERDKWHQSDNDIILPARIFWFDGDLTDPSLDETNALETQFGNSSKIIASNSIPDTEKAHYLTGIAFERELRHQIRPIYARPDMSAIMWRQGVSYDEPIPGWLEANLFLGSQVEWLTQIYFPAGGPIQFPERYWFSEYVIDLRYDSVNQNYVIDYQWPRIENNTNNLRLDVAEQEARQIKSYLSFHHAETVISSYKNDYPIIIHLGTFSTNADHAYYIEFANTPIRQSIKNDYNFRIEGAESEDGSFKNYFSDLKIVTLEGVSSNDARKTERKQHQYVGIFSAGLPGVYTNEITVKYKDGIRDNLKADGNLRELSYPVLVVAEAIEDPPELAVFVQDYNVSIAAGGPPIEVEDGVEEEFNMLKHKIFILNESNFLNFEYIKNGNIDANSPYLSPYLKKKLVFKNISSTSSLEGLFFYRKDNMTIARESTKNLSSYGVNLDITNCVPHFAADDNVPGLPLEPGEQCDVIITYQPDLSDIDLVQLFHFGYKVKENQYQERILPLNFHPIEPADLDTTLDKNSFRNLSGNLVPNASTLNVGKVKMTSPVVLRKFNDIRVFNSAGTAASFLNEYHNYLKEYNLKGFGPESPPPIDFIPPLEDYSLRGSHQVTLMKRILYPDGTSRFEIFGTQECFIGDDEYSEPELHYLEGFHNESQKDCFLSVDAYFNKDYIAKKTNFSDGTTVAGGYFSLFFYDNERLNISNTPLYFVVKGTFDPDHTITNNQIYGVQANFYNKSIQFDFDPFETESPNMGDLTGYRVFYSTVKNEIINVLYRSNVPGYFDIRSGLEAPRFSLNGLEPATYYYLKIYPIRHYPARQLPFSNPSFEELDLGEYLSPSNAIEHRIVIPSETTVFDYDSQKLLKKSYASNERLTFSEALGRCGLEFETFKKDGVQRVLPFKLINNSAWQVIEENLLYSAYPSGSINSLPHWLDTPPINVNTVFSSINGYNSSEISQAFSEERLFYLRNESNFDGAVQKVEGGGPSPVSIDYTNYVTPIIPFGIARCFLDTSEQ